jgi:CubicO group peptidase (beta-lactamase class C family)
MIWLARVVALLLALLPLRAAPEPVASPASADTAEALETLRQRHDLPALAVVVVKDGKICDRAAVGVRKAGDPTPVTVDDQFHIGSCTKSMTATLAALLIEEGKLRWNTTVAEVFPELKGKIDRQYEAVTLEQLLTHRGGCPSEPPAAAWSRAWQQRGTPTQQRSEFIQAVLALPPQAAPGTEFIYSNQGYAVAGAMLERITGKPWETLMTEKVFRPLGMKSAGFGVPGTPGRVDQPWGHVREGGSLQPVQKDNPQAIGPAGTVHCSLDDLARYLIAHLQRGPSGGLLKRETFRRLHTPPSGHEYACGWLSVDRPWARGKALTHAGSNTMWYLVLWLAPERNFAVAVATNVAGSDAEEGCDEVAAAMVGKWLRQ